MKSGLRRILIRLMPSEFLFQYSAFISHISFVPFDGYEDAAESGFCKIYRI
jgi:hypothetical protein